VSVSDPCCATSSGPDRELARELTLLRRKLAVGAVLTGLIVIAHLPHMLGQPLPFVPAWLSSPWTQLILCTPVMAWCGGIFSAAPGPPFAAMGRT